ncbi:MAG TPA: serine/threonine-protein kinase [Actinomycetota bacterium]|nr:serine/threonine-protein kinase [Actinomycetota bacterium]
MSDQRIGTELAGYRIESVLGRGGMSVVYLAEDLRLKRKTALKLLAPELAEDPTFRERFIAESELAAGLDHPNVIPIFEAGEAQGVLFIAMRYVRSTDLKALIKREEQLQPKRALSIVGQTASALDAAHEQGLVHRDVKPGNILVAERQGSAGRDHVYLADFGLTKRARQRTGLTRTGQFVGTVDYVSPEQIEGKEIDGRTDEYALACVLYECLTGDSPYPKDDETQVLIAHLMEPVPSIHSLRPGLPTALDEVIQTGMAKKKEDRFPDCISFVTAAEDAIEGRPSVTRFAPPPVAVGDPPVPGTPQQAAGAAAADRPPVPAPTAGGFQAPPPSKTFEPAPEPVPPAGDRPPPGPGDRPPSGPGGRRRWTMAVAGAVGLAIVVVLLVVLLGKGGGGGGGAALSPNAGGSPRLTGSPQVTGSTRSTTSPESTGSPAPGDVIFHDGFSDDSGGWTQADESTFAEGIQGGGYLQQIKVTRDPSVIAVGSADVPQVQDLEDVSVSVRAAMVTGTGTNNAWGIVCRAGANETGYFFVISANSQWAIGRSDGSQKPPLDMGNDPAIKPGRQENLIRGDCSGGTQGVQLTMFVNGTQVGQVTDTPKVQTPDDTRGVFSTGTVALLAAGDNGLVVGFDDFEVKAA